MNFKLISNKCSCLIFALIITSAAIFFACNGDGLGVTINSKPDFKNLCQDTLRAGFDSSHALCKDSIGVDTTPLPTPLNKCSNPETATDTCFKDRVCVPFKPIWQTYISKECKSCHPAEGGLRLDHWIRAYQQLLGKDSTGEAIFKAPAVPNPKITKRVVPYFPDYSLLYDVITLDNPTDAYSSTDYNIVLMPEEKKPTKALVDTIKAWINGGAKYKCP